MMSVEQARAAMLAAAAPLGAERVSIAEAYGRVLAAPLIAGRDQPPFDAAAMDGYAFASAAAAGDFVVVGESAAGRSFARALKPGEAVRISTGAPMPEGADGVLIQEDARLEQDRLIGAQVRSGRHVRLRGNDFHAGDTLLEYGRKLDPVALALAASAGAGTLQVSRQPRINVMAGGDEVIAPGRAATADQVYESGSFAITHFIELWGARACRAPPLPDDERVIAAAAEAAFAEADLIVLIGGASVGPHDHARAALLRLGLEIRVDKVAVQPGKPTWFGISPRGCVLGLPGNPASAIVCALLFLRPLIEAMLGRDGAACVRLRQARLARPLAAGGARETYLRAHLDEDMRLTAFDDQDSSLLSVFARANALIRRHPSAPAAPAGEACEFLQFA